MIPPPSVSHLRAGEASIAHMCWYLRYFTLNTNADIINVAPDVNGHNILLINPMSTLLL